MKMHFFSKLVIGTFIGLLAVPSWALSKNEVHALMCKLDLPNCDIETYEPVVQGSGSADKFFIETKDHHQFLLRLFKSHRSVQDRKREILVHKLCANADIAPKIFWSDPAQGILMDYIDYQPFDIKSFQQISTAVNAGQLLYKLHHLQGFPETTTKFEGLKPIIEKIKLHLSPLPDKLHHQLKAIKELEQVYLPHLTRTAVHNDVHQHNMLYDGQRFWLIDWEEAGLGDPYFDLASFNTVFIHNDPLQEVFLEHYFPSNDSDFEIHKFQVMLCFVKGYYGLSLLAKSLENLPLPLNEFYEYLAQNDTPPLSIYLQDEIDVDTAEKKDLALSLVLINDFLTHIKNPKYQRALTALQKKPPQGL